MLSSLQTVAVGNWKCSNYFFCAVSFVAPGLEKRGDTLLQSNLSGGGPTAGDNLLRDRPIHATYMYEQIVERYCIIATHQ